MPKAKQLTVPVENRPGTLAKVAKTLGEEKVNILAFLTTTTNAEGAVHVVVDNVQKAKKALESAGLTYTESDVFHVELPNVPGALATFAGKLATKDINVTLGHQTSAKGAAPRRLFLFSSEQRRQPAPSSPQVKPGV